MNGLRVLAVDDEPPALAEVAFLLRADERIAEVLEAGTPAVALAVLESGGVDAVFLDVAMPGLDGLALARLLPRFEPVPVLVFVTAHEESALAAFDMRAVDYVLKPVREDRLAEAVRRVVRAVHPAAEELAAPADEVLTVEVGTATLFVHRSEVTYAEAQGDYARLHTAGGSYLHRVTLSALAERWADAGFLRIHRSYLIDLGCVRELRSDGVHTSVLLSGATLPVSRRNARELRDALGRRARPR